MGKEVYCKEVRKISHILKNVCKTSSDDYIMVVEPSTESVVGYITAYDEKLNTVKVEFPSSDRFSDFLLNNGAEGDSRILSIDFVAKAIYECCQDVHTGKENNIKKHYNPVCEIYQVTSGEYIHGLDEYALISDSDEYDCFDDSDFVPYDKITCNYIRRIQSPDAYNDVRFGIFKIAAALEYQISLDPDNAVCFEEHKSDDGSGVKIIVRATDTNLYSVEASDDILSMLDPNHESGIVDVYLYDIARLINDLDLYAMVDMD